MNLKGKNILVSGAGGIGVGAGVCQALDQQGARIFLNEKEPGKATAAAQLYQNAVPIPADVSDFEAVNEMFDQIAQDYGPLDGLVNNAGIGLAKTAFDAELEDFQRLFALNIQGVWQMSRAFARQLIKEGKTGNIVNISSVHSFATANRYALYCSVKNAVNGLTKGMAVELGAKGIRCNAIAPGYVHAEQNFGLIRTWTQDPEKWVEDHTRDHQTLRHEIEPVDCGYATAFLLSDWSRSITGQTLLVDNGMTLGLYNNTFME